MIFDSQRFERALARFDDRGTHEWAQWPECRGLALSRTPLRAPEVDGPL